LFLGTNFVTEFRFHPVNLNLNDLGLLFMWILRYYVFDIRQTGRNYRYDMKIVFVVWNITCP